MSSHSRFIPILLASSAILLASCGGGEQRQVIQNKGSDTLVNVAQAWAEAYQTVNPSVVVAVSGGGSGTGIAALINGTVDLANASRAIKEKEEQLAIENGHNPVQHIVGYDALAIFLHHDNPLGEISLEQLAGIYGDGGEITRWTDLGIEVQGGKALKDQCTIAGFEAVGDGTYTEISLSIVARIEAAI